jgi:hypothetical protein
MTQATLALIIVGLIIVAFLYRKIGARGLGLIALVVVVLFGYLYFVVHSFNETSQVSTVTCHQITNTPHTIAVALNDSTYQLKGDRWELNGSVIRIQPWAYWLGVKSGYTLDRLTTQYDDTNAHEVRGIELGGFSLYKSTSVWRYIPLISAFGSGVIEPCDGQKYVIKADASGEMYAERA